MIVRALGLSAIGLLLVSAAPVPPAQTSAPARAMPAADACTAMTGFQMPGVHVKITSARHVAPAAPGSVRDGFGPPLASGLPGYCKVEGVIDPRNGYQGKPYGIGFAIALPDDWSGRFLLQGGGGLNGSVALPIGPVASGATPALARGFAVISHDSGHKGAVFDTAFQDDQRAALDFAEASVRSVTLLGEAMTAAYYGKPAAHSYMTGCSTGGRESMLASERYPELFDGIIVGSPAMRTAWSNLGIAYSTVMFNQAAPKDAKGQPLLAQLFSAEDRKLILDMLLAQCDGLDGLKDGVIENAGACHFRTAALVCKPGQKDGCLPRAKVDAIDRAFAGPRDRSGHPIYASVPFDTGIVDTKGPIPGYLPTGGPGIFGPASKDLSFDVDAEAWKARASAIDHNTETDVWTNLNGFTGHGGKILYFHGLSDPWFSANDTLDYWQRAAAANGAVWDQTSRLYFVPGMGHCQGGANTFDQFDLLTPLVNWVERGEAPGAVVAKRGLPTPAQRPMCPWPTYPHYLGGDADKPGSFECRGAGEEWLATTIFK